MGETVSNQDIQLIVAAADGNIDLVKDLVENQAADPCYQDDKTGMSVLMAASGAGHLDVVRYLLSEGSPWNAVDRAYLCAGDYAAKNCHQSVINLLMDHAVMSEMILSLAKGMSISNSSDESDDADNDIGTQLPQKQRRLNSIDDSSVVVLPKKVPISDQGATVRPLNAAYLSTRLDYTGDGKRLVDTNTNLAVMMDWERPLMARHAVWISGADDKTKIGSIRPGKILNVGFGMGIVDEEIQALNPKEHVIIEAHPQVIENMRAKGWFEKPGVRILTGRWQDVVPQLIAEVSSSEVTKADGDTGANSTGALFDGIFFDTYAEDDEDLRNFNRFLPDLLSPGTGRYSYYNGLCPDNVFFHGVACETMRLHLNRLGFDTEFVPIPVDVADKRLWEGLSSRYWYFDTYYMPCCTLRPTANSPDKAVANGTEAPVNEEH